MRIRLSGQFLPLFLLQLAFTVPTFADEIVTASATGEFPKKQRDSAEVREFEVRVDNKAVGTHRVTIESDGTNERANIQTDVRVDVIVYAYVFKSRGTEVWNGGRLESCEIQCEDGGKKRSITVKTDKAGQQVSFNGKPVEGSQTNIMSTCYWRLPAEEHRAKSLPVVDVDTGKFHTAKFDISAPSTMTLDGQTIKCRQVKFDGPSPAEVWFDDRDWIVKQKSVERGHTMELKLKSIRLAKNERPRK